MSHFKEFYGRHKKLIIGIFVAIIAIILLVPVVARLSFYYSLRPNSVQLANVKFNFKRKWAVLLKDNPVIFGDENLMFWFGGSKHHAKNEKLIEHLLKTGAASYETLTVGNIHVQAFKHIEKSIPDKGEEEVIDFLIEPDVGATIHIKVDGQLKQREAIMKDFLANNITIVNQ